MRLNFEAIKNGVLPEILLVHGMQKWMVGTVSNASRKKLTCCFSILFMLSLLFQLLNTLCVYKCFP